MRWMKDPRPLVAVDLVDVIENSWPQKRAWLIRNLGVDPGALCHSRAWVERLLTERHYLNGHACYEAMSAAIGTQANILRRRPVRGAAAGLRKLTETARIRVLCGRREERRALTEAWLAMNGMRWLCGRGLVLLDCRPRRARGGKLSWCARHGAGALVDNEVSQLDAPGAGARGIDRILFSCDPDEIARRPEGVTIARSWAAVVRSLRERPVRA